MIDPVLAQQLMAAAGVSPEAESEPVIEPVTDHAEALASILARAKGVRTTGEKLVDAYIDQVWTGTKLTKLDAARQGLIASEHNRAAWAQLQTLRGEFKSAVRKASRDSAHVANKISATSKAPKRTPELDAFLLQHGDNTAVQALAHMLGL